jgi:hypothetical protein
VRNGRRYAANILGSTRDSYTVHGTSKAQFLLKPSGTAILLSDMGLNGASPDISLRWVFFSYLCRLYPGRSNRGLFVEQVLVCTLSFAVSEMGLIFVLLHRGADFLHKSSSATLLELHSGGTLPEFAPQKRGPINNTELLRVMTTDLKDLLGSATKSQKR